MSFKEEYKRKALRLLVQKGSAVKEKIHPYGGWEDYSSYDPSEIDYENSSLPEETYWSKGFQGTFYDGPTETYGMEAKISFTDGARKTFRYEGTFSDVIKFMISEDEEDEKV